MVIYTVKGFDIAKKAEIDVFLDYYTVEVIHTVKGFDIARKAETDVFLDDYTVEVTNRFKGLDLIECLKTHEQRFVTLCRRQ